MMVKAEGKALIAMSGGVDSSVAVFLMKEEGYSCIGVTMKLYDNEDIGQNKGKTCCSFNDIDDARSVAFKLGIPHYVLNFRDEFKQKVIDKFVKSYENGDTPNPCIDCNQYLKFTKLYTCALEFGCRYVVTGHYARILYNDSTGRYELHRARDLTRDQSYFLYQLSQEQLAHTFFPLGEYEKNEVRAIAEKQGLRNYNKPDSQDICFVPNGNYCDFICQYTGKKYPEGDFIGPNNEVLGRHKGIIHYTIGQRKGLGLSLPNALYVKEIYPVSNTIRLCCNEDLFSSELDAEEINLISIPEIKTPLYVMAKIRSRHKEAPATVWQTSNHSMHLCFDEPQRAVTKGQSVVLYKDDNVVGGGIITAIHQ